MKRHPINILTIGKTFIEKQQPVQTNRKKGQPFDNKTPSRTQYGQNRKTHTINHLPNHQTHRKAMIRVRYLRRFPENHLFVDRYAVLFTVVWSGTCPRKSFLRFSSDFRRWLINKAWKTARFLAPGGGKGAGVRNLHDLYRVYAFRCWLRRFRVIRGRFFVSVLISVSLMLWTRLIFISAAVRFIKKIYFYDFNIFLYTLS